MIQVENIAFSYGRREVFRDVSFSVSAAHPAIVVGPNGAGKTTLLRLLAGLLAPVRGGVSVDGFNAFALPMRYHRALGYMPENAAADGDLTPLQYLKYRARLKGEQYRRIRHRVSEAMETCALEECSDIPIRLLSPGTRKRVVLAEAILLRPRVLLLDDPLAGMDEASRQLTVNAVAALSPLASVVISGHDLEWLSRMSTRFLLMEHGTLHEVNGLDTVRKELTGGTK